MNKQAFLTLLLCMLCSITSNAAKHSMSPLAAASANEGDKNLTTDMFKEWTAANASGQAKNTAGCEFSLNTSTGLVYGDVNVFYLNYADLSDVDKLYIVATEGEPRALFNRTENNGTVNVEVPRDKDTYETVQDNGSSKTYIIDVAKIVKAQGFAHLHAIKGANWTNTKVTSISYTLVNNNTSSSTAEGTYDLKADDFCSWTAANASGSSTGKADCAYELNISTGMPYGDGNVYYLRYADLTKANKLIVTATEGEPRILFNRTEDNGTVGVEVPRDASTYETVTDNGNGSKTYTVDVAKIVANYGFAHLHAIKGANWTNTKVTSIKYTVGAGSTTTETEVVTPTEPEPEPEVTPTEPEPEPEVVTPTKPETVTTTYYDLTTNDFYNWTTATVGGQKVNNANCSYELNASTGVVYGDVNVHYLNYADLSKVDKLYVTATAGEPRVLFNRIENNGTVGVEVPRDAVEYETVVDNGNGSKTYIVDIAKIVDIEGFAHLHAIKGANWTNTTVTSIKYTLKSASTSTTTPSTPAISSKNLPLDEFDPNIWETGKYNYNNGVGTFYAGQYGFGGWHYDAGYDVSYYKSITVTFEEAATNGTSFRLFKVNNYWTGSDDIIMTDCSGKTSVTVDITDVDDLYYIGFWNYGNANGNYTSYIKIKSVVLTPKDNISSASSTTYAIGDVNGDGQVTIADEALLVNILNGEAQSNERADINEDGVIDNDDAAAMTEILQGVYVPSYNWVRTWTTAQQLVEESNLPPSPGLSGNSIRQIVQVSIGGKRLRLKFSNEHSQNTTEIKSVDIAIAKTSGSSASIKEETTKTLTFNGAKNVTMAAGGVAISDPILFEISPRDNVAITIHYGNCSNTNITGHPGSRTTSYIASGNTTSFASASRTDHWYNICGIDVAGTKNSRAVAILGNSITDGRGSTTNYQDRWSDNFSRSLLANDETKDVAVLNLGIGGNCVLGGGLGPTAKERFNRDILQQPGVKYAIIFIGVNDIGYASNASSTANGLIEAYKGWIEQAHAQGIKIYGATVTPFQNSGYYSDTHEDCRTLVNNWIRSCGLYDGVIDFDAIMRDPNNKQCLQSSYYNSGDGLHPNAEGYKHMGESINLDLFK